ncbi:vacuolar protein-sorting-associated [Plasmopara halstedii]|uniref:Vacuolar protein-sorting-associated protein 36 n=1 Tax=Plasmopara halstedii TaxID=4781 RepID=A0A0P1A6V5_PLAHL|nr:vacuolar protein-sorting-associated [Plasmopara halstedii]CEG35700.1 vacuolar protein-sorting-associated [Plasmopara halstedii]|eukprot:XP_024572069.1 vacuolar protein-sorting-associated [Plasmopara halstedii]
MSEASSSPRSVSSSATSSTPVARGSRQRAQQTLTCVSVMDILQTLPLTAAGRPALFGNEVEIYSEEHIGLYDRTFKTQYVRGRCSVTTHRLFYMDETCSPPVAFFVPLEWITRVTKEAGFLQRSAKVRLDMTTRTQPLVSSFLKLSFKDGGRDDFFNPLEASLKRKAWNDSQPSHLSDRRLVKRQFNAADAGIAGIIRRQQEAQLETTELAATAFSDLANLMLKAKDMVSLIERYVDTQKMGGTNGEDITQTSNEDDINKLSSLMLDMGINSPVTRENSGAAYYEQLARQLAEFLGDYMPKNGGIMTLSDIYCMFNRARGVELVSPDDLYHAAMLQKGLKLGYSMRKFAGGLIVLQTDSHREDKVAERLVKMAQKSSSGYISSTDVSVEMHTSLPLAWEYLKVAEELGRLCRDETFEGTNFYPNKFIQFVVGAERCSHFES